MKRSRFGLVATLVLLAAAFCRADVTVTVDHNDGAIILHDLCMMVTDTSARSGVADVGRHHAHAVAVVAEQVGQHQMVCNEARFPLGAAIRPADRHGEGVQPVRRDPDFAVRLRWCAPHQRGHPITSALVELSTWRLAKRRETRSRRAAPSW